MSSPIKIYRVPPNGGRRYRGEEPNMARAREHCDRVALGFREIGTIVEAWRDGRPIASVEYSKSRRLVRHGEFDEEGTSAMRCPTCGGPNHE